MRLYNRKYTLIIGDKLKGKGIEITDLNISFKIKNSADTTNKKNSAVISVWNLSENTIKLFDDEQYISLQLFAGYEETGVDSIVFGDVVEVKTERRGTDRISTFTLAEGFTVLNHTILKAKTLPSGITIEGVIEYIRSQMDGISKGNYRGDILKEQIADGYPISGTPEQMLTELCNAFKLQKSIKNKKLDVSPQNSAYRNDKTTVITFNEESGLIDIPFRHINANGKKKTDPTVKKGVTFKALLNPFVKAGDTISIQSKLISGFYIIQDIEYSGEFRGEPWYINCYCEEFTVEDEGS